MATLCFVSFVVIQKKTNGVTKENIQKEANWKEIENPIVCNWSKQDAANKRERKQNIKTTQ